MFDEVVDERAKYLEKQKEERDQVKLVEKRNKSAVQIQVCVL